jgi:hypothetical protein
MVAAPPADVEGGCNEMHDCGGSAIIHAVKRSPCITIAHADFFSGPQSLRRSRAWQAWPPRKAGR